MRSAAVLAILAALASGVWIFRAEISRYVRVPLLTGSEHERYADAIRLRDLDTTELGRAWLDAGNRAVAAAQEVNSPFAKDGMLGEETGAAAWRFPARRGRQVVVEATFPGGHLFMDLLECTESCRPVASAADGSLTLAHDVREDGELILRVQPELLRGGRYTVAQRAQATLRFPVAGLSPRAVQSRFGDPRDRGSRTHEGVDVFAPRGTPVVAAVDGLITGSTSNRLGGNVVWLWSPLRGIALYYAHLDRQAVAPGDRVSAGDIVGWVGNTGNASTTAPHLHFGVYARPGGAVDPLPYICDAPCGSVRAQRGDS